MIFGSLELEGTGQKLQKVNRRKDELVFSALHFVLLCQRCCTHQVKIHTQQRVTQPTSAFADTHEILALGNGLRCETRAGAVRGVAFF